MRDIIEANWNYNSVYAAAKAEGAIVTADDLRKRYGATDEENAAPILKPIFARFAKLTNDRSLKKYLNVISAERFRFTSDPHLPREAEPTLEESLRVFEKELEGLDACLSKSKCDFQYEWEKGNGVLFPEFLRFKQVGSILGIRGRLLALAGRTEEAAQKFRLAMHTSMLTGDVPILMASQVRVATSARLFKDIIQSVASKPLDTRLRFLVRQILLEWKPVDVRRTFGRELFFNWDATAHIREYLDDNGMGLNDDDRLLRISYIPGVARAWRTRSLEYCRMMKKLLDSTHGDPIVARGAELQTSSFLSNYAHGLSNEFARIMMPVNFDIFSHLVQDIANREVLLASLDVLDERQKLGHWPTTLPVDRRDPFGMAELRYRVDGENVRIWSIGKDYKDSGGMTKQEDSKSDDLVVRL